MLSALNEFANPLEEDNHLAKHPDPCIIVIFGATGDLTARKLLPALYNLARDGQLPSHFACVGFARKEKSEETFRQEMQAAVEEFSRIKPLDKELWEEFSQKFYYHQAEFHEDQDYQTLNTLLGKLDKQYGTNGNRLFYLSTQPSFFALIIEKLKKNDLVYEVNKTPDKWSRIIIEKPFGADVKSAIALQQQITQHLDESQIYRIDHYLGKETVQNILVFRFSNPIFESLWSHHYVDHVQLTVGEEIGVGSRGRFWEEAGMLRDIIQNHMMQLLSLLAMEPPANLKAHAIHDEKVKVLNSIRPIDLKHLNSYAVRGQYGPGYIDGQEVKGYRQEENVASQSSIETYVALELFIDNWRWAGVPFYLRAGKRLPKRATEIAIFFKNAPGFLFQNTAKKHEQNAIIIRIQPDEGISLKMNCKVPIMNTQIQPVKMDFRYGSYFGSNPPEAYERLICDCMAGDTTLFARFDEVMASWRFLTPILYRWKEETPQHFPNYSAGSWGPESADRLLAKDKRAWRLI